MRIRNLFRRKAIAIGSVVNFGGTPMRVTGMSQTWTGDGGSRATIELATDPVPDGHPLVVAKAFWQTTLAH